MPEAARKTNVVQLPAVTSDRIPSGKYDLAFDYFEVRELYKKTPKLIVWFRVVGPEHMGTAIPAYYHLKPARRKQSLGRGVPFAVGRKSEFLRQYVQVFNEIPPRLDRIPMSRFEGCVVHARVRLVERNLRQRKYPKLLQYSVVDELLSLVR